MTDEMYSLLGRYFAGQASAEEVVAVEKWVAESEENKKDFAEVEQLWKQSEEQEPIVFDTNKAWNKVHAALQDTNGQQPKAKVVRFPMWKKAVAAAAVLLILFAGWRFFLVPANDSTIIADTDMKEVVLEDGSRIWLRKGATVKKGKFNKANRSIVFEGEAFFDITKDSAHPFTITTKYPVTGLLASEIKVLGTSFTVNTKEVTNATIVIVKTGKVSLTPLAPMPQSGTILLPGDKGVFSSGQVTKTTNDDLNFDSWHTGLLQFNDTYFPAVVRAFERHYNIVINIKEEDRAKLSALQFAGDFTNEKLETMLSFAEQTMGIRFRQTSTGVYEVSSAKP